MSWKPEYVVLMLFCTLVNYFAALEIHKSETVKRKRTFLIISLLASLGVLFFFKYFNFFSGSFKEALDLIGFSFDPVALKVLLPIGISFYTFQTLSYTIDVYRGKIEPENHFGIFALYVSFFPQLVAGPIERAKNLLFQFFIKQTFVYQRTVDGLKLMAWGFFKKVVIADNLAIIVNTVYNNPGEYSGISLMLATLFFAFQIYCDFSGYSDIAIGAAQVMGIKLMENFRRPYFSKSISEFWSRWHISLSTWFKDYLYIPLGGNRVVVPRWYLNLFIVFLVSGLWHGANWTFVIWGGLHGFYLVFGLATKSLRERVVRWIGLYKLPLLYNLIQVAATFILVNIGWVFFRANSLSDAFYILTHMFSGLSLDFSKVYLGIGWSELVIAFSLILFMEAVHFLQEKKGMKWLANRPVFLRWPAYAAIVLLILLFGAFNGTEFIYFQF